MEMNNYIIDFNNKKESIASYNNEEWKLLNFSTINSKYYISNFGRVKSITDKGIRIMKTQLANGYERIHILGKMYFIHRLVAIYFINNPNNLEQVNHKDFNKLNNKVDNLEWMSAKENSQYNNKNNTVLQIDIKTKRILFEYNSTSDAAISVNGDRSRIAACCNNKYGCNTHKGYIWRYKNKPISNGDGLPKKVIQTNDNGDILNIFDSLQAAANCLNVGKTAIHNVIKGYSKYCRGYKFYYD